MFVNMQSVAAGFPGYFVASPQPSAVCAVSTAMVKQHDRFACANRKVVEHCPHLCTRSDRPDTSQIVHFHTVGVCMGKHTGSRYGNGSTKYWLKLRIYFSNVFVGGVLTAFYSIPFPSFCRRMAHTNECAQRDEWKSIDAGRWEKGTWQQQGRGKEEEVQ